MAELSCTQVLMVHVIADGIWVVAFAMVLAEMIFGVHLAPLGILLAGVAAVLTCRGFLSTMLTSERNAFEMGRDAGRAEAQLRAVSSTRR